MRVLIISSYAPEVLTFRGDMILEMIKNGHEVLVAAPEHKTEASYLESELQVKYKQIYMKRTGRNPFQDIIALFSIVRLMKQEQPEVVMTYTIKPVIYGSIACRILKIRESFAMLSGLGSVTRGVGIKGALIRFLVNLQYKVALKGCKKVFFQNNDDRDEFLKLGLVKKENTVLINGSGVNIERFKYEPLPADNVFIFVGRLLKDKGIQEYCQAARIVRAKYKDAQFLVLGPKDSNPSAISDNFLNDYIDEGSISYLGYTHDVRPYLKQARVFVLPSYHEGTSRATLEAMATGRPILTTDAPGCRETVIDGHNGFLVPVRDSESLANKMMWMIENPPEVDKMGAESYIICKNRFDVRKVNEVILKTMSLERR